ncbi:MAG: primase-like DNA-binding domain-containing protein [Methylococcales bacterium]|nr:primase-like DNA-binding domain-containing protein [Methylococcales bacterium]
MRFDTIQEFKQFMEEHLETRQCKINHIEQFVVSCCELDSTVKLKSSTLYKRYLLWCQDKQYNTASQAFFSRVLLNNYVRKKHQSDGNYWLGLALQNKPTGGISGQIPAL